ncbi:MAG: hypothetical protein ACTTH5_02705 [Wolinella sp.]
MSLGIRNLVLATLFASGVMAAENGIFVGVDAGLVSSKNKIKSSMIDPAQPNAPLLPENSSSLKDSAFEATLKVGYHFDSMHRVYLAYAINSGKDKKDFKNLYAPIALKLEKNSKLLLGYDYTPELASMWRGVMGIYAGILYRDTKMTVVDPYQDLNQSATTKSSGGLFGWKLGAIYEVAKNSDIEFGMKFESVSMGNKTARDSQNAILARFDKQKQSNIGLYAGYVYKF